MNRIIQKLILLVCLLFGFTLVAAAAQATSTHAVKNKSKKSKEANQTQKLSKSKPVEGTLTAGQPQTYRLKLKPGYFVSLALEPQASQLTIAVRAPNGERLTEATRKSDNKEAKPVSFIADNAGEYLIELRTAETAANTAYRLAVAERRAATAADRTRLTADRLWREARQLRAAKQPESLPPAREKLLAALKLRRAEHEPAGEADILRELGEVAGELKEPKAALAYFQEELTLRRALPERKPLATALASLGEWQNNLGEFKNAIPNLTEARQLFSELNETHDAAIVLLNLSVAHLNLREWDVTRATLAEALPLFRATQDRENEAGALYLLGYSYEAAGELAKAVEPYTQQLELRRALKDQAGEASALFDLAAIARATGAFAQALEHYQQALVLWRALGRRASEAQTLNYIGIIHKNLGDKQPAIEAYTQALALSRELKNRQLEGQVINNLGTLYNVLGEPRKALEFYQQALPLRRELKDKPGEASTLNNIGTVHADLGESQLALEHYQRALELWRALKHPDELRTLQNIGETYDRLGEKQQAFDHYNQVLARATQQGARQLQASALNNLGSVYLSLGEKEQALGYYTRALELTRQIGDQPHESSALHSLGYLKYEQGEYPAAHDFFTQALALARKISQPRDEANSLAALGFVERELGHTDKALEIFNQALPLHRTVGNRGGQADTLTQLALTYHDQGQLPQAREALTEALQLARAISDPSREINTRYQLARLAAENSQLGEARTQLEAALELVETVRTKVASQDLRASYFAKAQKYYDLYIDVLMRQHEENKSGGFDGQALQTAERARARGLLDILNEAGAHIRNGVDAALLTRETNLQQRINKQADALALARNDEQVAAAKRELDALYVEYREVQTQIRQSSPRYAALTQPQPLALADIQKQVLDDDTLLLEFALGEQRSYLWAVTPRSIHSFTLPKRAELETAAQRLYQLLTARDAKQRLTNPVQVNGKDATPAEADAAYWREAEALSRALLGPIAAQLRGAWKDKRLLIVADGALQYLPFSALPLPRDEGGRRKDEKRRRRTPLQPSSFIPHPLVLDHEIVSLPSASTMSVLRQELKGRQPAPGAVAVIADPVFEAGDERVKSNAGTQPAKADEPTPAPNLTRTLLLKKLGTQAGRIPRLPATRDEAERIFAAAPNGLDGEVFRALDFQANRATVTAGELSRYRIVHLATHAYFDSERPELSAILLSLVDEQGQPQDGFLRAHEVYNFNLPAELVVLSACETGLGKEVRGEGLIGLTRGFMYAGAARVVVTLWAVSDKGTAELMARFYRNLLQDKQRPAAALRAAQIALWKEQRWQAPYYWAPFVLQGEWR